MSESASAEKETSSMVTSDSAKFEQEIVACKKRMEALADSSEEDRGYLIKAYEQCVKIRETLLKKLPEVDKT